MPELERDLAALAAELEWPATPDVAATVRARLADAAPQRRRAVRLRGLAETRRRPPPSAGHQRSAARRRALAAALAVAVLIVPAAAVAFPGARETVLDWLGLRHVAVERGAPPHASAPPAPRTLPLDVAARRARLTPLVPPALAGARAGVEDGRLILRTRELRLEQARGTLPAILLRKLVGTGAGIERVRIAGRPGLWFPAPHAYLWAAPDGSFRERPPASSGPSLVWEQAGLVLRLEGRRLTRARALAVARSARPHRLR